MYLHFPETCILCADLWSFLTQFPPQWKKQREQQHIKYKKIPVQKRDISADGARQCATKQQLNAHYDQQKKCLHKPVPK